MEINFSKVAIKELKQMSAAMRNRILAGIDGLIKVPPEGDIKPLQGKTGSYRLRIGKYRILYHYEANTCKIDEVGSRGDIYK